MDTCIVSSAPDDLRKTICVAKRVHKSLATGNGRPLRPSRSELFPDD